MLWERAPSRTASSPNCGDDAGAAAAGLTKELLRRVCEPFFDQMIMALLSVLQGQNTYAACNQEAFEACFQPKVGVPNLSNQAEQLSEEAMSDPGEGFAFSCVLDPPSQSQTMAAYAPELLPQANGAAIKVSGGVTNKDQDKTSPATVIVCRHWKSKGFCRMEDKCKFAHPDHKCGVPNRTSLAGKGAPAQGNTGVANTNSSDEEAGANADGTKKKKRRSKAKSKMLEQAGGHSEQPGLPPPQRLSELLNRD